MQRCPLQGATGRREVGGTERLVLGWLRTWSGKAESVSFRTIGSVSHLKWTEDISVLIFLLSLKAM
jgi:hypothetical protein